jgi:O-antigen ligase
VKPSLFIIKAQKPLDLLGLLAVLTLVILNAFHYKTTYIYPFYREFFAAFYTYAVIWRLLTLRHYSLNANLTIDRSIFFLLLFPVMLALWSFIDPREPLYGAYNLEEVSARVNEQQLTLYVLRNAVLYLPMVVYFHMRGLSRREIRLIALVAALIAPLSMLVYLETIVIANQSLTLSALSQIGEMGVSYNSYTPYLTFSVLCSLYLIFSVRNNFVRTTLIFCMSFIVLFCLFSTSRQSVLFVVVSFFAFARFGGEGRFRKEKWLILVMLAASSIGLFLYLTANQTLPDRFLERFGSIEGLVATPRWELALHGLSLLDPIEWLTGAGLTSVVTSGPHNDYIRWLQRVGVPLMAVGFAPFLIAFWRSFQLHKRHSSDSLLIFLTVALCYTLFHSFFGYPREDAQQALVVYLGFALWLGARREALLYILRPQNNSKNKHLSTVSIDPPEDLKSVEFKS